MRTNSMRFMQACRDALFVSDGPIVMNQNFVALLQRVSDVITEHLGQCLAATEGVELIHQLS